MSVGATFWDEELEHLSSAAAAIVGEDAVVEAFERAFLRYRGQLKGPASFDALKDVLKAELRRMVRPH